MSEDTLIGATIKNVRQIKAEEARLSGLESGEPTTVIELDNGVVIVPLADEEGNGPGHLTYLEGKSSYHVFVRKEPR